jgi:hypothetical protein
VHQELQALYEEDQADRHGEFPADLSSGTSAAATGSSSC